MAQALPPVPPLTKQGFEDPVWAKWLEKLRQVVNMLAGASTSLFQAVPAANQSLTAGAAQKVLFNTVMFNGVGTYTASQLKPNMPGKYRITVNLEFSLNSATLGKLFTYVYFNGVAVRASKRMTETGASGDVQSLFLSCMLQFNGTTDYCEVWAASDSAAATLFFTQPSSFWEVQYVGP